MTDSELQALKIAYTYMPQAIEVNEFDFAGRVESKQQPAARVRAGRLHAIKD